MSEFDGVNRRKHVSLLVHRNIAPKDNERCDGCEQLDQGNSHCALFDVSLDHDGYAEPGSGWFRTAQCIEAQREQQLYNFKTTGLERAAARSGKLFKEIKW